MTAKKTFPPPVNAQVVVVFFPKKTGISTGSRLSACIVKDGKGPTSGKEKITKLILILTNGKRKLYQRLPIIQLF